MHLKDAASRTPGNSVNPSRELRHAPRRGANDQHCLFSAIVEGEGIYVTVLNTSMPWIFICD